MDSIELTKGGIATLMKGKPLKTPVVLQVLGFIRSGSPGAGGVYRYYLNVSDGIHSLDSRPYFGLSAQSQFIHPDTIIATGREGALDVNCVIRLDRLNIKQIDRKVRFFAIEEFTLLASGPEVGGKIGSPVKYSKERATPGTKDKAKIGTRALARVSSKVSVSPSPEESQEIQVPVERDPRTNCAKVHESPVSPSNCGQYQVPECRPVSPGNCIEEVHENSILPANSIEIDESSVSSTNCPQEVPEDSISSKDCSDEVPGNPVSSMNWSKEKVPPRRGCAAEPKVASSAPIRNTARHGRSFKMGTVYDDPQEFNPLSETEREVCEAAVNHFAEEDFQTSAEILASIVANRPNDHRFRHNLAVAEFRQRSCTNWKQFEEDITKAFSDVKLTPDPEGITQDNIQYPVLWFNLAVLYFHQKRYQSTLTVVDNLSKTFCNVMTPLTKRTKLLLIDVLTKLQQYERALNEIELFEAQLRPGSVDISSAAKLNQSQQTQPVASPVDSKLDGDVKIKLQQYKTLCHLCMKSLKFAKKEFRQLFITTGSSYPTSYIGTFMKAYHDYLRGNVKKAYKIIINLNQPNSETETPENILRQFGDIFNVMCLNNKACCELYLGKPTIAGVNFQKAAVEYDKYAKKDRNKLPLFAARINSKLELLYNFGVTLLNLKRPTEAFGYLNMCLNYYYSNPRLWLRVAECCIQIHKSGNEHHLNLSIERKNLVRECKGADHSKKLIFVEPGKAYKPMNAEENIKINDREKPTLEYASICLENALRLVEADSIANEGCLYVRPSTPISNIQEINSLHAAILCAAAYVQLTLENYPVAIKRCHQLMSLQNIPGAYQYLAKMYLGEAYFKYGQLDKAHDALFQDNACDTNFFIAQDVEEKKDDGGSECNWPGQSTGGSNGSVKPITEWYPNDDFTARAILVYNQAVALASSGDLDKASEVLRAWISKNENRPLAPEFLKLAVYLHIRLGNIAKAKSLLKNSSGKN